jgi:hypothetical protein
MLTQQVIGRKINRWIVVLQEFDLYFISAKSKKSLVLVELISELPFESGVVVPEESPIRGDMFFYHIFGSLVRRYTYLSPEFEVPHLCFL